MNITVFSRRSWFVSYQEAMPVLGVVTAERHDEVPAPNIPKTEVVFWTQVICSGWRTCGK